MKYASRAKEKQSKTPEEEKNFRYAVWGCIFFVLWVGLIVIAGMNNLTAGCCVFFIPLGIFVFIASFGILAQNKGTFVGILKILRVIFFAFSWIIIFFCAWTKPKK